MVSLRARGYVLGTRAAKPKRGVQLTMRERLLSSSPIIVSVVRMTALADVSASDYRIAPRTVEAGADRDVSSRLALRVRRAFLAGAGILTEEIDTGTIVGTLAVGQALSPFAIHQSVADVTGRAGTNRSLLSGVIVAWRALGVLAAGIRSA